MTGRPVSSGGRSVRRAAAGSLRPGRAARVACAVLLLAGCAAGPDYRRPEQAMPIAWQLEAPWREARPADAADKGPWWQRFGDPVLDDLQRRALAQSPTLAVAAARLAQSRAALAATDAAALPQIGAAARASRQKISANRPLSNYASPNFSTVQNELAVALTVGYEVDLAGRVSRSVEAARAASQQAEADFANTRLVLGADLAAAYFNLRAIDAELDVLDRSLGWQRRALALVQARREGGAASGLELAQQQALLDATRVQLDLLERQRGPFEHAIATLTGQAAPGFAIARVPRLSAPPAIALGVPSELLQRRPDIAGAERAMAAANAQIGVASAAVFPSVTLGGSYGGDARSLPLLLDAKALLWSLGASATATLFDGGRIQAGIDAARAGYDATVANYRRVVLAAMQEVEDGITGLAALERAAAQSLAARSSAQRVLELVTRRWEGGASSYADVAGAQQAVLGAERQSSQLDGQRLVTAVFLVKALGGDWDLPPPQPSGR